MILKRVMLKILLLGCLLSNVTPKTEKELHTTLLTDYNVDIRPIKKYNQPVTVHYDMRLQMLVGYDIKTQILTIRGFNMLRWVDANLKWNKSDYSNIDRINVGSTVIWTPDIVLYNTALEESKAHTDLYKSKILVHSDGRCIWNAPITWQILCSSDITWFPIDRQECFFSFGSWSYTKSQLKVLFWSKPSKKEDLESDLLFVDNGQWGILDIDSIEKDVKFICCNEEFSTIEYKMILKRLYLYYFMYIILPLISLSFLFLLIFHIPYEGGERMGFGVTILLSITVYLLVISEKLPEKSDKKPMLGIIFTVVFYELCIALGLAVVTSILPKRKQKPPYFLLKLIHGDCLGRVSASNSIVDTMKINKDKKLSHQEFPVITTNEEDYREEWEAICRYLDKRFFFLFLFLLIAIPTIVCLSLPNDVNEMLS